jgi:hypothetical protein
VVSKIKRHLTYANVMATLALFIALGGSSYAAVRLSANSVGSRQIKRDAVKESEIAKSAVESAEVRNGSLRSVDFARMPLGAKGEKGALGPRGLKGVQGDRGPTGPHGPAGADAATSLMVHLAPAVDVAAGGSTTINAPCNPGERAVGGGVSFQPPEAAQYVQVTGSYPGPNTEGSTPTSWSSSVTNQVANTTSVQFTGYALCISP